MLSKFAIIALVPTITPILAQHTFKAYSDPFCTKPLKVLSGGDEVKDGTLVAKKGISSDGGFPGTAYEELTFPDAETQPVYWKSADPGPGCGNVLMRRVDPGHSWGGMSQLPGTVLINARREGCFYSGLQPSQEVAVSFCCGDGDCSLFDLGTHQLTKRDSEPESEVRRSASPAALAGSVIRNSSPGPSSLQSHSKRFFTNRRADDTANCRVKREINTTLQIGPQRAVTNIRPCSSEEPCKWTTSEEYSAETAVSSSKSYTVETSTGGEVSISTGVKFLGTGTDISTSLSWSVAESTTEESGYEISTGKVTGISEEFPQVGFSNAFLTFTPIYHCFKADYECEGETLEDVSTCYPQTVGDKETVVGSYNVVYT